MREHQEHDEHKQPSARETVLCLLILFALATAIWFFVEESKYVRVNTSVEADHLDSTERSEAKLPEG